MLAVAFHAQILAGVSLGDFHATFTPPAAASLALPSVVDERLMALWALEFSAEWLVNTEPIRAPRPTTLSIGDAVASGDPDAAADAVHAACGDTGWPAAARALAPGCTRALRDPHATIFLAQVGRGLRLFGASHAPALLEIVARNHARRASVEAPHWDRAKAETPRLFVSAQTPAAAVDDAAVEDILAALTAGPGPALTSELVRGLDAGWTVDDVWAAVASGACGLLAAQSAPSGLGVHTVTMTDGASVLFDASQGEDRWLVLHQVAQRVAGLQELLRDDVHAAHLGGLEPDAAPEHLDDLVAEIESPGWYAAPYRLLGWLDAGGTPDDLLAWLRRRVARLTTEPHDVKVTAALQGLQPRLRGAWGRRALAMSASLAMVHGVTRPWTRRDEALSRLAAAGLG